MGLAVHVTEFRDGEVRIDLRRRKRGVAELFLDETEVCTVRQEVRGASVPKLMRGQVRW